jgi:phage tail sheath gpL-like
MTYSITGIPSSFRAPITAAEIIMGQGAANAPLGARDTVYIASMLASGGSATAGVVVEVGGDGEAASLFGAGSAAHRCARMHIRANKAGRLYVLPYLPSSGVGLESAEEDFTITGTASGTGSFVVSVCGTPIEIGYRSGDTPTVMGDALEAKIAASTFLPVGASNSAGTVTVEAKIGGASQNGIHRIRVVRDGAPGTGVSVAAGAATLSGGVEGAVTELTNFNAALATITSATHYYRACPVTVDDFVDDLKAHVASLNEPNPGIFCKAMTVSTGALAATADITTAQNSEICDLAWQRNSDHSPDELLANWVAIRQKRENTFDNDATAGVYNFDGYSGDDWFIKPAPNPADWPDLDDLNDAINDGITPIASTQTGSYVVMSVSTRSKDSTGALDDFRATETHRISAMHALAAVIKQNWALTYRNFMQQDNPRLPDGSIDLRAVADLPRRTIIPFTATSWFLNQLTPFFVGGKLQRPAEWEEATDVRIDPQNSGRMQFRSAGRTTDLHHQATFRLSETTPN